MKYCLFLFLFLAFGHSVLAQQDAWVYFTDKVNVEAALQNPITILSQQAIDRKNAHNIPIDARDVPVNPAYILVLKTNSGIEVLSKSKWLNAVHVRGEATAIAALANYDFVDAVDFADKALNDVSRSVQHQNKFEHEAQLADFTYGKAKNQVEMIQVDALHQANYTGEGIIIAVIDAGFPNVDTMAAFQRLRDNNGLLGGYDFVNQTSAIYDYTGDSHGTRVLSTMAGYVENKFVGTAPDASYYLFRTENDAVENPVEESYWVEAAERADSLGVHIINSSLGYNTFDNSNYDYAPSDMDGKTTFISRGANFAAQKGMLVVNSAGNSGNDSWGIVTAPADAPGVLTVGAVNSKGQYAGFSSRGSAAQPTQKPDVVAQGSGSFVIDEKDRIVANNGTSFSSPIVAGAMASLWQAMPNVTAEILKQQIRGSASQFTAPDDLLGYGIPNFDQALAQVLSVPDVSGHELKVFPNPVKDQLYIQLNSDVKDRTFRIYDVMGKLMLQYHGYDTTASLDVSQLTSGLYLLTIVSDHKTYNFKFIKS